MPEFKLDFSDLERVANDLAALSKAENRRVLNQATRAAANVVTNRARKLAPVRTGKLRRNIVTMSVKASNGAASGVHVRGRSIRGKTMKKNDPHNAFYWRFMERGTKNISPRPFIQPAYDASINEMESAFIAKANSAIDAILSK